MPGHKSRWAPPPRFPVLAADGPWVANRGVDHLVSNDGSTEEVWVTSADSTARRGVRVGNFDPDHLQSLATRNEILPVQVLMRTGVENLSLLLSPQGLAATVMATTMARAQAPSGWVPESLLVNGESAEVPVWRFADGWVVLMFDSARRLIAIGVDIPVDDVQLIATSMAGEQDLRSPIDRDGCVTVLERNTERPLHPDYAALLK